MLNNNLPTVIYNKSKPISDLSLLICPTCGSSLKYKRINPEQSKNYTELDVKAKDKIVKKIGNWTITENFSALSKSLVMSNTIGDRLSMFFKGKSKVIYFLRHDWSGIADIFLDEKLLESLDLYRNPHQYGFEYIIETDNEGEHNIEIVVSGKKNPKSNDCQIWVDGFGSFQYKFDEIFYCGYCKARFPLICDVVDFTQYDDEMAKNYNAFFKAGGDNVYEFDKNPEIAKIGHFLRIDVLDSLIQDDISDKTIGCWLWILGICLHFS